MVSGEFFVPFLVLVMNHEHKELPTAAEISRKSLSFRTEPRIQRRFMPIKPTPIIPIFTIVKSLSGIILWHAPYEKNDRSGMFWDR
jgi:hypothetical protein